MQVQIKIEVHISTQLLGASAIILARVSAGRMTDKQVFLIK